MQAYLSDLDSWVRYRKDELDELDAAALSSPRKDELTDDMALSMALWKAVADRLQLLFAVWDGGRVLEAERERLATLIHGRLDATLDPAVLAKGATNPGTTSGALAVSLPEACRLSDALAGQLRQRLALDPAADANAARVKDLRASLDRLRDQLALEPDSGRARAQQTWDDLAVRIKDITERLQRGGDVGGLLGPLENDTALLRARPDRRRRRAPRHPRPRGRGRRAPRGPARPLRGARAARGPVRGGGRPGAQVRRARRGGPRSGPGRTSRPRRLPRPSGAGRRRDEPRPRVVRRRAGRPRRPRRPPRRTHPEGVGAQGSRSNATSPGPRRPRARC